jgi:serine/threonine-protein kinase
MAKPLAGRYALVRQLVVGRDAVVFEATDLKLSRSVALKAVATGAAHDAAQRLELEGRIVGGLVHPNIVAVTDMGHTESGVPFLVFELLVGESLGMRLEREGALPVAEALSIGEQMLSGLAAAHVRGIVHRDVKPGNVFLLRVGVDQTLAKVIDFGIARIPGMMAGADLPHTDTGFVVGTPQYMAPEQVRGLRDLDARTDVYAAGLVMYEMFSGERPFADRPPAQMLEAIAFEKIPALASRAPHVPPQLARAVDAALGRDPSRRHADANAFLRALRGTAALPATGVTQILEKEEKEAPDADPRDWNVVTQQSAPPEGWSPDDET